MSGICGVVHWDGSPVPRELVRAMTASLAFRGPDRQASRVVPGAGFGHAWLRTDPDAPQERQPLSFDGRTWIVADARVDDREGLAAALRARGREVSDRASDAAMLLHAWHAWEEACVEHLLGDFAFAIWDGDRRRLFCARDHFGVKRLFFANDARRLVLSNTLDCVRLHPGMPQALDDLAIADFLLFEFGQEPDATAFAAIRRLPPASTLVADAGGLRVREYWSPPRDHGVRYRRAGDYAEHLRHLLAQAVADRLRTNRVGIQMSGGLDSTALAALARSELSARGRPFDLQAHAIVYDRLVPDGERRFAAIAGAALGVPVRYCRGDDHGLYERFADYSARFPEPYHAPDTIVGFDSLRGAAAQSRVLLTGYDGDTLLSEAPRPYWRQLWRERRIARLGASVVRAAIRRRRAWPGRTAARPALPDEFPPWLNRDLVARLGLRERWRELRDPAPPAHELRPRAHRGLWNMSRVPHLFDQYDPGVTGLALECRHPFLDLRVVDFCLGLPPEPWCEGKEVLRIAMKGLLPEDVRLRPKTSQAAWPAGPLLAHPGSRWVDRFAAVPGLDRYVDRGRVPPVHGTDPHEAWAHLRALTLNMWLQRLQPAEKESLHETA